jgi:archaemetzincin
MLIPHRFSRRELIALVSLPIAGLLGLSVRHFVGSGTEDSDLESAVPLSDAENVEGLRKLAAFLKPLFSPLADPAPDEWLAKHVELGQTFIQFVRSNPTQLRSRFQKICIVPLGDLADYQRRLFADTQDYLKCFFGIPIDRLDAVGLDELPAEAQRIRESGIRQIETSHLLRNVLHPLCDDETAAVFGLTASDVWDGDFNYLFGQGAMDSRTCVGSVARFGDVESGEVDYATCLRRTIGLATHEIGHVCRIPHCTAYSCRMNGSNNLAEADRRPLEFCPECLPKIWWTWGVDPAERFDKLLEFAVKHELTTDAELWRSARKQMASRERSG